MSGTQRATSEGDDRRAAQDEVLVEALSTGMSYAEAGAVAEVSGRTVARRMTDPEFARRVAQQRGARVAELTGQLTAMGGEALAVIRTTMAEGTPSEQLRAAQLALSLLVRFRKDDEVETRVAEMERRLEAGGASRREDAPS